MIGEDSGDGGPAAISCVMRLEESWETEKGNTTWKTKKGKGLGKFLRILLPS